MGLTRLVRTAAVRCRIRATATPRSSSPGPRRRRCGARRGCCFAPVNISTNGLHISGDVKNPLASAAKPSAVVQWRESAGISRVGVRASGFFHLVILIKIAARPLGRCLSSRCMRKLLRSPIGVCKRHTPPRAREMRAEVGKLAPPSNALVGRSTS